MIDQSSGASGDLLKVTEGQQCLYQDACSHPESETDEHGPDAFRKRLSNQDDAEHAAEEEQLPVPGRPPKHGKPPALVSLNVDVRANSPEADGWSMKLNNVGQAHIERKSAGLRIEHQSAVFNAEIGAVSRIPKEDSAAVAGALEDILIRGLAHVSRETTGLG